MLNAIGVLNATRFNKQMLIENPGCGHENVGWVAGLPGFTSSDFFTCDTCFWFFFSQHRSLSYKSTYFIFHVPHLTFPNASLFCRRNARHLLLPLGQGFSTLTPLALWVGWFFVVGSCPVHFRVLDGMCDLCPPDASSTPPLAAAARVRPAVEPLLKTKGQSWKESVEWDYNIDACEWGKKRSLCPIIRCTYCSTRFYREPELGESFGNLDPWILWADWGMNGLCHHLWLCFLSLSEERICWNLFTALQLNLLLPPHLSSPFYFTLTAAVT